MACAPIIKNGERIGFMCGEFSLEEIRIESCSECDDNVTGAEFLCDYPVGHDKTCDRYLCKACAKTVGRDMHYCPSHHQEWREFRDSREGKEQILSAIESGRLLPVIK